MSKPDGGPAAPHSNHPGMTLADYYTAHVAQGLLASGKAYALTEFAEAVEALVDTLLLAKDVREDKTKKEPK